MLTMVPYPFQGAGINHAVDFLTNAERAVRQLYAAPTGCGKSVVELMVQEILLARGLSTWIISPREEIIHGMLQKLNDPDGDMLAHKICTPIRLRNMLLNGTIARPDRFIIDETHHESAETYQQLDLLAGLVPTVGYTATPYRGSPRGTKDFAERWGDTLWLITYQEAVAEGYISKPTFEVLPLVDDDIVEVRGGEFDVTSLDAVMLDRLGDMADHAKQWYNGIWDRPTIFAMPTSTACTRLQQELLRRGIPAFVVSAATPKDDRYTAFEAAKARIACLLHINIVSEGVDLPLRRLVDMAPTMSPVKWVQHLGRITRPVVKGEASPEYICTNRNILRHAYALDGVVPTSDIVKAEMAFPRTERAHTRVLGLEAIGRFKPAATRLLSGVILYTYRMSCVASDGVVVEYAALVHPTGDPIWASKFKTITDGKIDWGTWRQCEPPTDLKGFSSLAPSEPSPKQLAWWKRSAARAGLDPEQEINRKSFSALPVLSDLGVIMR